MGVAVSSKSFEGGDSVRVFKGLGLNFSTEIFGTFLKKNFEMHLIPFKITLHCILNTFIFLVIGGLIFFTTFEEGV